MAYRMFSQEVSIMGVPLEGEAKRGIASARAMSYLLKKNFDRMIAEQKSERMETEIESIRA